MSLLCEQIRSMHLAGTVAVPPTFPELGRLSLSPKPPEPGPNDVRRHMFVVEHSVSPSVSISRTFFLDDVAAIFVPADPRAVRMDEGIWLLTEEIFPAWPPCPPDPEFGLLGIAYVREEAATLMQVDIGMTAAESVEYHPSLSQDRSVGRCTFESREPRVAATEDGTGGEPALPALCTAL